MTPFSDADGRTAWTSTQKVVAIAVVVAIAAIGVWVVGGASTEAAGGPQGSGDAVIQVFTEDDRVPVEPFAGTLLDGQPFDSRDNAGKVVVYNVWGSWCAPCRTETPALRQVARETDPEVAFVGINVRDSPEAALAFERSNKVPYPSLTSEDGANALLAFGSSLGVAAVPTTLVVDPSGRIAGRIVGPTSYSTLRGIVDEVLAGGSPGA
ncbi:Redoxin domain protein (Precursor) [Nocardioides sp. PD653]|nr:Redoxin domain protein (Precursor) [Nocardioides sp. PD653-B2]GAW56471.1 Redoxin domain protein (Precursor) [Nocardioides sp. PD653]